MIEPALGAVVTVLILDYFLLGLPKSIRKTLLVLLIMFSGGLIVDHFVDKYEIFPKKKIVEVRKSLP